MMMLLIVYVRSTFSSFHMHSAFGNNCNSYCYMGFNFFSWHMSNAFFEVKGYLYESKQ
jgi:hypothetical protein